MTNQNLCRPRTLSRARPERNGCLDPRQCSFCQEWAARGPQIFRHGSIHHFALFIHGSTQIAECEQCVANSVFRGPDSSCARARWGTRHPPHRTRPVQRPRLQLRTGKMGDAMTKVRKHIVTDHLAAGGCRAATLKPQKSATAAGGLRTEPGLFRGPDSACARARWSIKRRKLENRSSPTIWLQGRVGRAAAAKNAKRQCGRSRGEKNGGAPGFSTAHCRSRRKAAARKTGGSAEVRKGSDGAEADGRPHAPLCWLFWEFRKKKTDPGPIFYLC